MKVYPAMYVHNGHLMHMIGGRIETMQIGSQNPTLVACQFEEQGAEYLHFIDLNGSREDPLGNMPNIKRILNMSSLKLQVGGGIRTEERIRQYLDLGVKRVVLGTIAVKDPDFVARMAARYGDQIAVGVAVKGGKVVYNSWKEISDLEGVPFCRSLAEMGVHNIIYTDIGRDGKLEGSNLDAYRELMQIPDINLMASGGISSDSEIIALRRLGLYGVIISRAFHTNTLSLPYAISLASMDNQAAAMVVE